LRVGSVTTLSQIPCLRFFTLKDPKIDNRYSYLRPARLVRAFGAALTLGVGLTLTACAQDTSNRALTAIESKTPQIEQQLTEQEAKLGAPVFIRIVKTVDGGLNDGYLELFLQNSDNKYAVYKKWPICTYSGNLGPKLKEGDGQSPEGFYFVTQGRMNPHSSYHLSFNLGFPNAYDRAQGRTGSYLMVHGDCVSIGCYAMTDDVIEEIYTLMTKAFDGGQSIIRVHAFPFPMTAENMERYKDDPNIDFWRNLKTGWDWFESSMQPPNVDVSNKEYSFSDVN